MQPDAGQQRRRTFVLIFVLAGTVMFVLGLLLTLIYEDPLFLVIAGFGLVDFFFAILFSTGRLGAAPAGSEPAGPTPEDPDQVADEASDDPRFQPYRDAD